MATGPMPQRRVLRCASERADQGAEAAQAGDDPQGRRSKVELIEREEDVRRAEDAPQGGQGHLGAGEGAQDRVAHHETQPGPDLPVDRGSGGPRWRRRLDLPDAADEDRRDKERDGIEGHGEGRRQDLDQDAADAEGRELGGRSGRRQRAVRLDQPLAFDDRRQVGVVGRVEEARQDRGGEGDHEQLGVGQPASDRRDRDGDQQHGAAQVGPDSTRRRSRRSTQAPATRPTMSVAARSIERSTATSMAPASRTMMASSGSASRVMSDPKMEIVDAVQMRTKARLCQSGERNAELGKRTMAEDSGPDAACGLGRPCATLRPTSVSPEPAHQPIGHHRPPARLSKETRRFRVRHAQ